MDALIREATRELTGVDVEPVAVQVKEKGKLKLVGGRGGGQ